MEPLSALDALFLHLETDATPMHVGVLHLLTPPAAGADGFAVAVRRHVADRLPYAPVLARQLRALPLKVANPVWEVADEVDLETHVRTVRLRRPGTHAQLLRAVGKLHGERLDLQRPPWAFYVFEGLASGRLALYSKIHHAALDGAAGVALAHALLDPDATPRRMPLVGARRAARSGLVTLLGGSMRRNAQQALMLIGRLPDAARSVVDLVRSGTAPLALAPRSALNVAIDGRRRIATATAPLASVRAVAARHDVTVNDVVLAMVSGALRRYFEAVDEWPAKSMVAAMPVSLRAAGDERATTLATMTLARLATDVADPIARLRAIHEHARTAKALARQLERVVPPDFPSLGLPWLLTAVADLYGRARVADRIPPIANLVVSNVPGPATHLYLAGARLDSWWPLSIVEHGLGLNITVESYAGALDFGLVAAASAIADLRPLARGLESSLADLDTPAPRRRARAPRPVPHRKK